MDTVVRTKIIKIGNSRGVRIPRALLEQAGLADEVEMLVQAGSLVIQPARQPRQGWEAQFASMVEHGDDQMLNAPTPTRWDKEEWTW